MGKHRVLAGVVVYDMSAQTRQSHTRLPVHAHRNRILAARALALVADAVQLGLLPLFIQGAASPLNDALDVAVGAGMVALVGWHWVFLPTFVTELLPFVDLAPTWTIAALIATRQRQPAQLPDTTARP